MFDKYSTNIPGIQYILKTSLTILYLSFNTGSINFDHYLRLVGYLCLDSCILNSFFIICPPFRLISVLL